MKTLSLKELLPHLSGYSITDTQDVILKSITIKPEKIRNNTLFFNLDRRRYLASNTFNKTSVIITDIPCNLSGRGTTATIIKVKNIYNAYWDFINYYRDLFKIPVIGITGTCGKTTTTAMVKTILSKKYRTRSSFDGNNAWYLSFPYLMGINKRTQAAVFEMGVGAPGHLRYICKHLKPQVGVLLNIGTYHLLGCKTQNNYIKAKGELLEGMGFEGTLILNADDKNTKKLDLTPFKGTIIYFGFNDQAHFKAKDIKYGISGMEFTLHYQQQEHQVYVPGYGEHNVYNALAALAVAHSLGFKLEDALERLAAYKPVRQHIQLRPGINGCTIIDDTWNCTPPSMESGLKVLKDLGTSKKTVAVMGYMPQLGVAGDKEYYRIGRKVAELEIDALVTTGDEAKKIGVGAIAAGFDKDKVIYCRTANQLYLNLLPLANQDSLLLFKFPYKYRLSKDPSFREFMSKIIL